MLVGQFVHLFIYYFVHLYKIIINRLTTKPNIIDKSFFDRLFSFMSLSVKLMQTDYEYKSHR